MNPGSEFSDTKAIYNLTHRQVTDTEAGRLMREFLWAPFGGYIGQLSWATKDQIDALARAAGAGPHTSMLDLCCGTGGIGLYIARAFGCPLTGVDYAERAIAHAADQARRLGVSGQARFIHGDARHLPFGDASFDAVISVDSLVIVPNRQAVLAECARVLRPGGVLAFSDEVVAGSLPRDRAVLRAINVYGRLYPETRQTYLRLLDSSGFAVAEVVDTTTSFTAICDRWAAAYRRYRAELTALMGAPLFEAGHEFFATLAAQSSLGAIRQARFVARKR